MNLQGHEEMRLMNQVVGENEGNNNNTEGKICAHVPAVGIHTYEHTHTLFGMYVRGTPTLMAKSALLSVSR